MLLHEGVERYSAANFRMLRPFIISTPALPVHVRQLANAHSRTVVLVHTLVALLLHSCSNIECRIVMGGHLHNTQPMKQQPKNSEHVDP